MECFPRQSRALHKNVLLTCGCDTATENEAVVVVERKAELSDTRQDDRQKELIVSALLQYRRVDAAAESLGLHIRKMYRLMHRYNLRLKSVLAWPSMPPAPATGQESAPVAAPEAAAPAAAKPERDIRPLTARDFTGKPLGDVGSPTSHIGSADELLDRYQRLKGN